MTRREGLAAAVAGLLFVVAGLTWRFGPWGLIGSGLGIAALALFGLEIKERHGEAVADAPAHPRRRRRAPVQLQ